MGKKRVIKKTTKEVLAEQERIEKRLKKAIRVQGRKIKDGRIYIVSSYNNTKLALTDETGNVLAWASAGSLGFKGAKKATPFAATRVAGVITQRVRQLGVERVKILVKGIGAGRTSALRSLANQGLEITSIEDITPLPHNGCRAPKPRRV